MEKVQPMAALAMETAPGKVSRGRFPAVLRLADAASIGDHAVDQQDDDRPADGQQPRLK